MGVRNDALHSKVYVGHRPPLGPHFIGSVGWHPSAGEQIANWTTTDASHDEAHLIANVGGQFRWEVMRWRLFATIGPISSVVVNEKDGRSLGKQFF
jgi:hypothetical protein